MGGWLLAAGLALPGAADVFGHAAAQNKAYHTEIRIVPAPGPATVDGVLADWEH